MKHILSSDFQSVTSVLASVLMYKWSWCESWVYWTKTWCLICGLHFHLMTGNSQATKYVVVCWPKSVAWLNLLSYCIDHISNKGQSSSFSVTPPQRWRRQWFLQSLPFICTSQTPSIFPGSLPLSLSPFVFRLWEYGCMSSDCWIEILMWSIKAWCSTPVFPELTTKRFDQILLWSDFWSC